MRAFTVSNQTMVLGNVGGTDLVVKVALVDAKGPLISNREISLAAFKMISAQQFFFRTAKTMTEDMQKAKAQLEQATVDFEKALDRFKALENNFTDHARAVSGRVRDASTRLADGLARVEKAASLAQLERHCSLLERMAESMERLSALESSGKLARISSALAAP